MCKRAETTRQPSKVLTGGSLQGNPVTGPATDIFPLCVGENRLQLTLEQLWGQSEHNIQWALCICCSSTSEHSTKLGLCRTAVFTIEKYPRISGPAQFKPELFKD